MARAKKTVAAKVTQVEVEKAVEGTKDLKVDTVVVNLASVRNAVANTLADLEAKLNKEVQLLTDVQVATKSQQERLKELYGIESESVALDDVRAQREEAERLYNEEVIKRNIERDLELKDYNFNLERERRLERIKYQDKLEAERSQDKADLEAFETELNQRADALATQEAELVNLREQVAAFPDVLAKEVSTKVAVATNSLKSTYETEKKLIQAETDKVLALRDQQISSLSNKVTDLINENVALKAEMAKVREDAQTTVSRVLDAEKTRQELENMRNTLNNALSNVGGKTR